LTILHLLQQNLGLELAGSAILMFKDVVKSLEHQKILSQLHLYRLVIRLLNLNQLRNVNQSISWYPGINIKPE